LAFARRFSDPLARRAWSGPSCDGGERSKIKDSSPCQASAQRPPGPPEIKVRLVVGNPRPTIRLPDLDEQPREHPARGASSVDDAPRPQSPRGSPSWRPEGGEPLSPNVQHHDGWWGKPLGRRCNPDMFTQGERSAGPHSGRQGVVDDHGGGGYMDSKTTPAERRQKGRAIIELRRLSSAAFGRRSAATRRPVRRLGLRPPLTGEWVFFLDGDRLRRLLRHTRTASDCQRLFPLALQTCGERRVLDRRRAWR